MDNESVKFLGKEGTEYILDLIDNMPTKNEVDTRIQNIIGAAPADLDTLEELAEKLQDGDDIHTALIQSISEKAPKSDVEALQTLTANYCFNGITTYDNIDNCIKKGFYLIDRGYLTSGTNIYNLLTVNFVSENSIRQHYIGIEENKITAKWRIFTDSGWSDWVIAKTDGSNIVDSSITNSKIANGTITNAKLAGASVEPAANKIPIADANGILPVKSIRYKSYVTDILTIGWYRVAILAGGSDNIILNIARTWDKGVSEAYAFSISKSNNGVNITQLSGKFNFDSYHFIDKIRVVLKSDTESYIDIHYNNTRSNPVRISGNAEYSVFQSPTLVGDAIPEGYTATEFKTTNGFKASVLDNDELFPKVCHDYTKGVLIKLKILSTADEYINVDIEGTVNSNTKTLVNAKLTFHNYVNQNVIDTLEAINYGVSIGDIKVFHYNDHIYLWFALTSSDCTFKINATSNNNRSNLVDTITNEAMPTDGVTNLVTITPKQAALITDNVASADKLTTKQLTNEDLNNIKDSDFSSYFAKSNNTCSNKPTGLNTTQSNFFNLQVVRAGSTNRLQIFTTYDGVIFRRTFNGTYWSAWKRMLTEDDLPKQWVGTAAEYGALTTKDANTLYLIKE